ncbi:uncharacterized protein OCT59_027137 [Rhizophagus irregularis]|uniref:Uncharacterized protein n=2 Tax=Rhizophagus irregularis TaxID=588596 RepID=U9UII3_RHIID|nr:hypothetical protein GLOIN_2v1787640 [Rhizophagus irregularis DAOM 181602=DAOM 197198]EXX62480.1 hypothetical protein RirG_161360 [Rhizophagus irregularis DAOM 197198w]POG60603.1 hypothetical protein GLOIN_2v1787640 [Rhizophagus irregularis DAOM 181602=DAOM 197198]UZO06830.1 hypothetical protein OCT59_027137 [Rhizophagus irregularis]GBC45416.1 hypothetical protein GLOIN_2v1787640 [Rhizophagus irregularis DAOM 181602=DAOM 197198]|eukprot:XP_025167469.1 hypothetical protein GLOIN_2v1787640 [Rhizophagus irregularis DAOM 181602=DAOM 197198]
MDQPSLVLIGKKRIWKFLRGAYNFNKISNKQKTKKVIEDMWIFCYNQFRLKIWNQRCEIVSEIEKDQGLTKKDLRLKRKAYDVIDDVDATRKMNENGKTNKNDKNIQKKLIKKIKLVMKDRLIGKITEEDSIKNNWYTMTKLAQ